MSRFLRIFLALVAAAVVAVVLLVAAVAFLLKPADYAPVLARAVQAATGRPFELRGALHPRFFPCCGIAVDGASLGNPPGFPAGAFAEVEGADLGLRLWPLIVRREVEIGRVTVRGLRVSLVELADGRRNWDFGTGAAADGGPAETATAAPANLRLAGLRVTEGRVDYRSARSGSAWRVENLSVRTGEVRPGAGFDLDVAGGVRDGLADRGADLHLAAAGTVAPDGRSLTLRTPKLTLTARGAALPVRTLQATLAAQELRVQRDPDLAVVARELEGELAFAGLASLANRAADGTGGFVVHRLVWRGGAMPELGLPEVDATIGLKGDGIPGRTLDAHLLLKDVVLAGEGYAGTARGEVRLQGLGAQLTWQGAARRDAAGLGATGHLRLDPVSPRSVLAVLGHAAPATADPAALTRLAGGAELQFAHEMLTLQKLDVTLDRTRLTGGLRVALDERHTTNFDLRLDALDLDRYRPPKGPEQGRDRANTDEGPTDLPTELPREGLRNRAVAGTLAAGQVTLGGAKLRNVTVTVRLADGALRLDPFAAELYGGTVRGAVAYDAAGAVPQLVLGQQLAGVNVGQLLGEAYQSDRLQGTLSASVDVRGQGRTEAALLRALGGNAAAKLANGAYRGVDFWYEVRKARALLRAEPAPPRPASPATPITRCDFSGRIAEGVWRSDTIAAEIPFVHLGGTGTLDLAGRQLDLALRAQVTGTPTFADGTTLKDLGGFTLPLTVAGPMSGPKVGVDLQDLARNVLTDKAKDRLKNKLRELFNR